MPRIIQPKEKLEAGGGGTTNFPEVGIYKRKQESKKKRKPRSRPRKRSRNTITVKKMKENTLSTKKAFKKARKKKENKLSTKKTIKKKEKFFIFILVESVFSFFFLVICKQ